MSNDQSMNDINKPKKGLLQSLHSLSFSDDAQDDEDTASSEATTSSVLSSGPSVPPVPPMPPVAPKSDPVSTPSFMQNTSQPSVVPSPVAKESYKSSVLSDTDLADPDVTVDTIESSMFAEMRKNMDSVKTSSEKIKQKTTFELITSFGKNSTEVLFFNTFLTKEMPYTSKTGKTGTQRVNFFGVMTESGVYAVRASSAITSKLEDALKHTSGLQDDTVGILGEGTQRRIVMKLPAEEYGSSNVLHIALVGDISKQNPELFTGLDAVNVDGQFIEDLMTLAVSEVEAMTDYEKRRRANLRELQNETAAEVKKASAISDKLNSINL